MADIGCAWCAEPWDASGLRQEGTDYLDGAVPLPPKVEDALERAHAGDDKARRAVNIWLYRAVLSGTGCPARGCGFAHTGDGPHREEQLRVLVMDGVTDDDPAELL
ncbi:MAG: hypothetical protein QOJ50_2386 [Cryptosporangiaceae bacterium]|nr:hypothetical protein [Cryptosporangiaceae bacterium]